MINSRIVIGSGAIASLLFIGGTLLVGLSLEGYSSLSGTVSEMGRSESALAFTYQFMLIEVSALISIMAYGLLNRLKRSGKNTASAYLLFSYSFCTLGLAIFPSPHSLHNVFALALIGGFLAPLIYALTAGTEQKRFRAYSGLTFGIICLFAILNLSPLFAANLVPTEYYGIVQRGLLYTFYLWLGSLSLSLLGTTAPKPIHRAQLKLELAT